MNENQANQVSFTEQADLFDELPLWSAPFGHKLLEAVVYNPGIKALDIGFGTGFPFLELAMRLGKNSTVYGIDPWQEAVERVRKKMHAYQITNAQILDGLAENIPLPDCSIDLIVSNNGLNNVNDQNKAFAECSRVAKKGCQFVQTLNTNKTMEEFYAEMEYVLSTQGMHKEIQAMHEHIYEKRKPIEEIEKLLHEHHFQVTETKTDEFCYLFSNATAMFNHYFIKSAFMAPWLKIVPKEKQSDIFKQIENNLNNTALKSGRLKLTIPFALINAIKK